MKIVYKNQELEIERGKKVYEIFKDEIENSDKLIVACKCNNEVRSLNLILNEDSKLELLDISDADGMRIYIRGLLYIMGKAFSRVCNKAKLTVNYQLSNAMFCEIDNMEVTEELIAKVKNEMKEIVNQNIPIKKVKMTLEEAKQFYEKEKSMNGRLQIDIKQEYGVSLYYCEDYYNYFFGVMPISTGFMRIFDIVKYKDGFLIRYPSKQKTTELGIFVENKKLLATMKEYDEIYKVLKINTIAKLNSKIRQGDAAE